MEVRDKLGRYENGKVFASLTLRTDNLVDYKYGMIGFSEYKGYIITSYEVKGFTDNLMIDGYVKVTETPVSEGNNKAADDLLDWIGGITR